MEYVAIPILWLYGQVMASWYMLRPCVTFGVIWYIFPRFGMSYEEESGNPVVKLELIGCVSEMKKNAFLATCKNAHFVFI
jgi:hypothetical protein